MNNRERTYNILHYKSVDRLPAVHFGYWDELIVEWVAQGHVSADRVNTPGGRRELEAKLGFDFGWESYIGPTINLYPKFKEKVLETLPDGSRRIQNRMGVIERVKPGIVSIPSEDDYQLKDRKAFEELYLPKMQFSPERIDLEFWNNFNNTRDAENPVGLFLGSVLGHIRDMTSVVGMSYLLYDEDEELFADIVDTYAEMQYQCAKAVLETGAKFDYAHFWEDICFKNGPLLSPKMFDELCAKHYKKRTDLCREYGIDIVSLDCDGVIGELIPTWIENGVNTMFPIEVGVWGDQFAAARETYGKKLLGVGGMDKTVFLRDRATVDEEIERMKRLSAEGGFIPCPDHRLMPGTKFELVQYYTEEIKKIKL